ncbi:hypothetical protein COT68_02050 [bacterium (Candidatus Torokbacteria) CG09_land_8_20_14_0_10_42_11]|nr:MAG: hypothetical protein COT68_02050 [bacterium (Candidatus Torokbacteria) CG09_land_8_20_14_0_10_42_11]
MKTLTKTIKQGQIKNRVFNLEQEILFLKKFLIKRPNFDIDEKNWQKLSPKIKKIRGQLYREQYEKKK